MNPLSKLILIPSVLSADWSWHYLSFWELHGLKHWVIKYCPSGSRDLSIYDREPLVGLKSPRSFWGCSKSEFVCMKKWADHKPGSQKWIARLPLTTMPPGLHTGKIRLRKRSLPIPHSTWTGKHRYRNGYTSEACTFFLLGILNQLSSQGSRQLHFWKSLFLCFFFFCNSLLKLPCYSIRVPPGEEMLVLHKQRSSLLTATTRLSWVASHLWLKYQKVTELLLLGCCISVCLNQACTKPLEGG